MMSLKKSLRYLGLSHHFHSAFANIFASYCRILKGRGKKIDILFQISKWPNQSLKWLSFSTIFLLIVPASNQNLENAFTMRSNNI